MVTNLSPQAQRRLRQTMTEGELADIALDISQAIASGRIGPDFLATGILFLFNTYETP